MGRPWLIREAVMNYELSCQRDKYDFINNKVKLISVPREQSAADASLQNV